MGRPKKIEAPVITPAEQIDEFAKAIFSVESEIEKQFPESLCRVLKKIAYEIGVVGLTEAESCMISDYPHEKFITLKQLYPIIQKLVEVKDLEYKRNLLKSISTRAGTDDKVAMWLLEAKYPSEFNRRKGNGGNGEKDPEDLVGAAIEFVRKSSGPSGLISEESGRAFLFKTKEGQTPKIGSVQEMLA